MKFNRSSEQILSQKGFTLVEIMIVLTIIALIATFATRQVISRLDRAKVEAARTQIRSFGSQLDTFKIDCGNYPTTDQGMAALIHKPTTGTDCPNYDPDGYLKSKNVPKDPWNHDYIYESDGSKYSIRTLGQGGVEGGDGYAADISSDDL